jgi:ribosomal protein S21
MEKERRRYETMLEIRERRHADRHSRMKRLTVTVSADVKARAIAIAKNGPKVMEV